MSIVALKKLTLCGLRSEQTEVLKKLQVLGGAHLIPFDKQLVSIDFDTSKSTDKVLQALNYLIQCANKRKQIKETDCFDREAVVQQVLQIQTDLRTLTDQRDFLINRIEEVKPWGDFDLSTAINLDNIKFWFYIIPKRLMPLIKSDLVYQVVHVDNIQYFVVVLAETEPPANSLPVPRTHTGKVPLSSLQKDLQDIELALEDKQAERESLTRWITLITLHLLEYEDFKALTTAEAICLTEQNLFLVQAWVPTNKVAEYNEFAENNNIVAIVEDIKLSDSPPTLLENPNLLAGGEELVKFYQMPAYNDWDPSRVLFFSFAFFFAMILSDAGYASIFGLILSLKWKKLGKTDKGKRLRILALVTIIFSMIWGVFTGGYFGYSPAQNSFAGALKIININDFDSMMRLSIAVGVIHIILANSIKAYQGKTKAETIAAFGWICLVIGGFMLWLISSHVVIEPMISTVSYSLLILGFGLLLFFSSERVLRQPIDILWKLLDGFKNITRLTKIFGDILSYMRLFALGLASASLAITFNQLAEQAYLTEHGLGLLSSILILILGHTLNLMLCLMSGVVHGLRLNFIEFYNWSISDEGYAFKAFSKKGGR